MALLDDLRTGGCNDKTVLASGTVTLTGPVGSGADTYRFTGEILDWNAPEGAWLAVDGEPWSGGS